MTIDGVNVLTEYGFGISRLISNMDFLKRKKQAIHNWLDENGEEYMVDQGEYFYEPKDILATCFVHGTSKSDFQGKIESIKTIFETPGLRTVCFDSNEEAHLVYAKHGATLSRMIKLNDNDNVAKFVVKLREPQPYNIQFKYDISEEIRTGYLKLSVATGYTVDIHWGDGEVTTGVTGADQEKTHTYPRKNVYYITIVGDLDQVTKFSLFGAELILNGDFAAWTTDNPDNWGVDGEVGTDPEISEVGSDEGHGGVGTGSCNIYSTGSQIYTYQDILTIGKIYLVEVKITKKVIGSITIQMGNGGGTKILSEEGIHKFIIICDGSGGVFLIMKTAACDVTIDNVSVRESIYATSVYGDAGKMIKKISKSATEFDFHFTGMNRYSKSIIPDTLVDLKLDGCAITSGNDIWQVLKDIINDGVNKLTDRPTSMNIWLDGGTNEDLPAAGQADYDTIAAYLTTGSIKVNGYS